MVIDTSALIAILLGEPEAKAFSKAIANAPKLKAWPNPQEGDRSTFSSEDTHQ